MALRPFLRGFWDDPWEDMVHPSRLFDQHFGNAVTDEFYPRFFAGPPRSMLVSVGRMQPPQQTGISEVENTDKEFRVRLDVQHFKPDDISIKTKDNRVIVNARHEERPDEHGFIMREFTRQYVLPKDVDPATVTSSLGRDGVLVLKAPKTAQLAPEEHAIPITMETEESK